MSSPRTAVSGRGRFDLDPVIHATHGEPRTRYGRTLAALCGAAVWPRSAYEHDPDYAGIPFEFDRTHRRACARCAAVLDAPLYRTAH